MVNCIDAIKKCAVLRWKKIQYISRSLDLIDIGFGDMHKKVGRNGKMRNFATYAIHIQCPFRVINQNEILTGSEDLYISSIDESYIDLNDDSISLFDDIIGRNINILKKERVTDIKINEFGDLEIKCQNIRILVFVAGTTDCEAWRFFEVGKDDSHLVVSGKGFEFQ